MTNASADKSLSSSGWLRVRRIIASLLVLAATVFFGVIVGKYLALVVQDCQVKSVLTVPVDWGLAGIGLSYLFGSIEKVLKLTTIFRDYIAKPDKKVSLYPDCFALAFIVAYVTVLVLAFQASAACKEAPKLGEITAHREVVYLSRIQNTVAAPFEYVPLLFKELAAGDENPAKGTTLSDQQVSDIERLVASLKACVGSSQGQDVEVDVRGYADSNEFASNSEEQNRNVANRRAAAVHAELKRLVPAQTSAATLILRPLSEWSKDDPLAMTRERYFKTRPLKETGREKDQGIFNRRADILILNFGVCERFTSK
jgi:hypothetical protein